MAIGDAGAAWGLTVYPSTQTPVLGYQNDNQRADDIAAEGAARVAADALAVKKINFTVQPAATALPATPAVGDVVVQY
jgi:hypothetical protein